MTRIVGGRCGGTRIRVPTTGTRPTSDRVREALFSSIESWLAQQARAWSQVHVLDLYAGSGALGLEAASRGAATVTLVESDRRSFATLEANCGIVRTALGHEARITPLRAEAGRAVVGQPVDIAFLDPPYSTPDAEVRSVLTALVAAKILAPGALVVVERAVRSGSPWPQSWLAVSDRTYGDTRLWYGHHVVDDDPDEAPRKEGRSDA